VLAQESALSGAKLGSEYSGGRRGVCPVRCGPVRASLASDPGCWRVIYFPGRLPDEKKGNMFGRSTPSPERAPDGPLNLNGSIKSADSAAATLLDHPAETGTADRNGEAPDSAPAHGLDTSLTSSPPYHLEVEHVASKLAADRSGAPERKESEEQSEGTARTDQAASAPEPAASDKQHMRRARVRGSLAAGGKALVGWRGLRSTVSGVALVVLAASLGLSSAPSIASLVAGVLMLIVGLIGPRLQGRFAIEFGPHGASIEIQTHIAPRGRTQVAGALAPRAVRTPGRGRRTVPPPRRSSRTPRDCRRFSPTARRASNCRGDLSGARLLKTCLQPNEKLPVPGVAFPPSADGRARASRVRALPALPRDRFERERACARKHDDTPLGGSGPDVACVGTMSVTCGRGAWGAQTERN
jgi:hypothetical protein